MNSTQEKALVHYFSQNLVFYICSYLLFARSSYQARSRGGFRVHNPEKSDKGVTMEICSFNIISQSGKYFYLSPKDLHITSDNNIGVRICVCI